MTYFWLGVGGGIGAMLARVILPFLALIGRGIRHQYTIPTRCAYVDAHLGSYLRRSGYPEWYVRWVVFRECACL